MVFDKASSIENEIRQPLQDLARKIPGMGVVSREADSVATAIATAVSNAIDSAIKEHESSEHRGR